MKITYRIPNKPDMFAYLVELECDETEQLPSEISSATIAEGYKVFSEAFKPEEIKYGDGLPPKEWRMALDEYLTTNNFANADETYFKMSPQQQYVIQEIKKSVKRLISREQDSYDLGAAETMEALDRLTILKK